LEFQESATLRKPSLFIDDNFSKLKFAVSPEKGMELLFSNVNGQVSDKDLRGNVLENLGIRLLFFLVNLFKLDLIFFHFIL
jgi:hypothetical protein